MHQQPPLAPNESTPSSLCDRTDYHTSAGPDIHYHSRPPAPACEDEPDEVSDRFEWLNNPGINEVANLNRKADRRAKTNYSPPHPFTIPYKRNPSAEVRSCYSPGIKKPRPSPLTPPSIQPSQILPVQARKPLYRIGTEVHILTSPPASPAFQSSHHSGVDPSTLSSKPTSKDPYQHYPVSSAAGSEPTGLTTYTITANTESHPFTHEPIYRLRPTTHTSFRASESRILPVGFSLGAEVQQRGNGVPAIVVRRTVRHGQRLYELKDALGHVESEVEEGDMKCHEGGTFDFVWRGRHSTDPRPHEGWVEK